VTFCIVSPSLSDRISRAAINAGAHGPIVFLSEGRGLRDRLGWLRITKEREKEVLMVIAEEDKADQVFNAMAKGGELHLPGRGFMYRLPIDRGVYNLPSRAAGRRQEASLQQIIHAIDHLQGHTHWRDRSLLELGGDGVSTEMVTNHTSRFLDDHYRVFAMVSRSQLQPLVDLLLDSGAPGLNFNVARAVGGAHAYEAGEVHLNSEYALVRSICDEATAQRMAVAIEGDSATRGVTDVCVSISSVDRVATYVPGHIDYRAAS
ncbi:MAG: hypothetical protein AAF513_20545, partial [Pseudomonadota bacterium]